MPYFKINGTPTRPRKKLYSITIRAKDEPSAISKANRAGVLANEVVRMLTASFIEDVVGVTHNNDDGSSRQEIIWTCKAGERLILEHESDNRHDKHAIRVMRQDRTQVGYLSKEIAKEIYDEFLQIPGWQYSAITLGVHFAYPPDFETLRVGIFLANASEEGQTILARLEEFAAANQQSFDRLLPLIEIPSKLFKAHRKQAARGSPPSFVK